MSQNTSDLSHLNPRQREAVEALQGPLLILAGAGSGKTRVLTYRTAQLILEGLAAPNEIFAVTFTNKAAREMESRIVNLLSDRGIPVHEPLWISTFHSSCARLLRQYIHLLDGYESHFSIYDQGDQLSLIKKILNALKIDEKLNPAKSFQARINSAKTKALDPQAIRKQKGFVMDPKSLEVYEKYEEEMRLANALDFSDLLLKTYELLLHYPVVLENLQNQFKYIMVDEYQDTNRIQYLLIKQLAKGHRNLCVVGDEDQSIYSWRGADISNILEFEKDFPEAKVVKLEQNYRSTNVIVSASTELIKNNEQRKDKTLFTDNDSGEKISIVEETTEYDEAKFIAKSIEDLLASGEFDYRDFAIFYRTNAQSRVLEEQCRLKNINYKIVGGLKFYERMEIKDVLSYMKLILNPGDDVAIKRVINVPARGIGKTTIEKIEALANADGLRLVEGCARSIQEKIIHKGAQTKVGKFLDLLVHLRTKAEELSLVDLYTEILHESGYLKKLKEENTPEAESRIENLEELQNAITQFCDEREEEATLQNFLEEMALVQDVDRMEDQDNSVTLMTLHISKGLEFPVVFVAGCEEGLFPTSRAIENSDITGMEEERRLCYVGMTRAQKLLFMTYARQRRQWGSSQFNPPSRFLNEIPEEYIEFKTSVRRPKFMDSGNYSTNDWNQSAEPAFDSMPSYEDFGDVFDEFASDEFKKGQRVRHPSYGVGAIYRVDGSGENAKVSVLFDDKTLKKFVVKYARLERV